MRFWFQVLLLSAFSGVALGQSGGVIYRAVDPLPEKAPGAIWAKPLQEGPLRLLVIAPHGALHDVKLLEERLDSVIDVVGLWSRSHLGHDPEFPPPGGEQYSAEAVRARLAEMLETRHDVVLLGNVDTRALPDDLLQKLIDKLYGGTGLVTTHLDISAGSPLDRFFGTLEDGGATEALWRGVPELPLADLHRILPLELDAVRAAIFQWAGDRPKAHAFLPGSPGPEELYPTFVDDSLSLILRAVHWVAGRKAGDQIMRIEDASPAGPDEEEIPPDLQPEFVEAMQATATPQPVRTFRVHFAEALTDRYTLRVQLRRLTEDQPFHETSAEAPRGATQAAIDLLIGQGDYLIDAWLEGRKGVVDWYTETIRLEAWPTFENLQYEKPYLMPNDSLEMSLRVPPVISQHRSGTLYARAVDNFGRLVAESAVGFGHEGGSFRIRLNFADLVAPMVKVELFAIEGPPRTLAPWERNIADREHLYFAVRRPSSLRQPRFVVAGPAPNEPAQSRLIEQLREKGADTLYLPGNEMALLEAAYSEVDLLPELSQYKAERAGENFEREPCLSSADFLRAESMALQKKALTLWAGGVNAYSLGNPNYLCASDEPVCQHPATMQGFRSLLELEYGSLEALNQHWNSPFTQWADIVPLARSDARTLNNYPPAIDFWEYMDGVFAAFHGQMVESVAVADPQGETGFRALGDRHANNGYDWAELLRQVDFVAADPDPLVVEKLRSYSRANRYGGLSVGDTTSVTDGLEGKWLPWYATLHSLSALWYQMPFGLADEPAAYGLITARGDMTQRGEAILSAFQQLEGSLGALLLAAEQGGPHIAILESRPSRRITELAPTFSQSSLDSERAFCRILDSLGYTYHFIDEQSLTAGGLDGVRVLMLPSVHGMSEGLMARLEDFVEGGGAVLADVMPGTHDRHGVLRSVALGAELFGHLEEAVDAEAVEVESGAEATAPLQPASKGGQTLLLDRVIAPELAVAHAARSEVADFLAAQGVLPPAELDFRERPFAGKVFTFDYGVGGILAFLAAPDEEIGKQDVRFGLDKDAYVYAPLTGMAVARPQKMRLSLEPGAAEVYTILPYRVDGVEVGGSAEVVQGQRLQFAFRLKADVAEAAQPRHLFQVDLISPWGRPLKHYRQLIESNLGGGGYIPLALDEPAGTYHIRVREAMTGMRAEFRVEVLPRGG